MYHWLFNIKRKIWIFCLNFLGFAQEGKTVIINTLEIPEIQKVADRCVVFYEGRIVRIFEHSEVNEHDVMLYSTNAIETTQEAAS